MVKRYISKLTPSGYDALVNELQEISAKRKPALDELVWARDLGDRSENGAYKSARSKISRIDSRIRFLKKVIENSEVIKVAEKGAIDVGCEVVVESDGKTTTYRIVGDHEADPLKNMISYKSPVGRSLMGRKVGDNVKIQIPSGQKQLKIQAITI